MIDLIDTYLAQIAGRKLVSTAEVADLLLDIRLHLSKEAEHASSHRR